MKEPAPIMALDVAYNDAASAAAGVYFSEWSAASAEGAFSRRIAVEPCDYEPGEFYKRELPALLRLLDESPVRVSTLIVDGYVWLSGDGRPGLGARLYEAMARAAPVIGVAKTRFRGDCWSKEVFRGGSAAPLYVTSAGMPVEEAASAIAKMSGAHRIPTLLKQADDLARKALT
jgi:deoxyribonuclease V